MPLPIQRLAPLRIHVVAVAPGGGRVAGGDVEPSSGPVSANAPTCSTGHRRQPRRRCSGEPHIGDAPDREPRVDAEERRERRVGVRHLHREEPAEQAGRLLPRTLVVWQAGGAEVGVALDEVGRELRPGPVLVRSRRDLRAQEPAHPVQGLPFPVGQQFLEAVEVAGQQFGHAGWIPRRRRRHPRPAISTNFSSYSRLAA